MTGRDACRVYSEKQRIEEQQDQRWKLPLFPSGLLQLQLEWSKGCVNITDFRDWL